MHTIVVITKRRHKLHNFNRKIWGTMDETYSKSIDNCLTLLIEQLGCPDSLIIWLKVRKILNVADCKLITKPTTNEAKFHRLLDILKLKPDGWDGLINYLIDHNMKWIADRLLSNWKVKISEGIHVSHQSAIILKDLIDIRIFPPISTHQSIVTRYNCQHSPIISIAHLIQIYTKMQMFLHLNLLTLMLIKRSVNANEQWRGKRQYAKSSSLLGGLWVFQSSNLYAPAVIR